MEFEKYIEIIKFLRKMDGRKKSFLEDYACSIEELVAANIYLESRVNPKKYAGNKEALNLLKTAGALKSDVKSNYL